MRLEPKSSCKPPPPQKLVFSPRHLRTLTPIVSAGFYLQKTISPRMGNTRVVPKPGLASAPFFHTFLGHLKVSVHPMVPEILYTGLSALLFPTLAAGISDPSSMPFTPGKECHVSEKHLERPGDMNRYFSGALFSILDPNTKFVKDTKDGDIIQVPILHTARTHISAFLSLAPFNETLLHPGQENHFPAKYKIHCRALQRELTLITTVIY